MLKNTRCELDLISDPAMFEMLDSGMRGGISVISKRYAEANNKYMGSLHDACKPSKYLIYLDANNLYGKAMSYPMPQADFKFLTEEEWSGIRWAEQMEDQPTGYYLECDLEYPAELHDAHNDYPLAPERLNIEVEMLSETQIQLSRHYDRARAKQNTKLVPNLINKTNYITH